jgi:hypothetical protein
MELYIHGVLCTRISIYLQAFRRGGVINLRFLEDVAAVEQIQKFSLFSSKVHMNQRIWTVVFILKMQN